MLYNSCGLVGFLRVGYLTMINRKTFYIFYLFIALFYFVTLMVVTLMVAVLIECYRYH